MAAMTEEEALARWCPNTFATPAAYTPEGNPVREGGPHLCVGSNCMAWRWKRGDEVSWPTAVTSVAPAPPRRGYCGLAGPVTP